jgi:hypothetical protein
MSDVALDQVVELALKLSVAEQAKLLERVAAHLAREVDETLPDSIDFDWTDEELNELFKPGSPKTGIEIATMLESGELDSTMWSEMINPHITDPVEWVKALRRAQR